MTLSQYTATILNHRWAIIGIAVSCMLAMAAGSGGIGVTNDYRSLFDDDNPQFIAFEDFENTFGTSQTMLVAIAPRNGSVFSRDALGAIQELTEAAWETPYSIRVDSLTNHSRIEGRDNELIVEPLIDDAGTLDNAKLLRIRETALDIPEISGRLVSHDGKVGGLAISFALPDNRDAAVAEITDHVNVALGEARARHPGIAFHVTGYVPLNRTFAEATLNDLQTLAPFALLVIVIVAVFLLRSVPATVATVSVIGLVVGTTLGFAGWAGIVLSPASSGVPIIVMTIAVAHSIHIVTTVQASMSRGMNRNAAITESIRINAWPVFLTSLTTAIGFLSLNASDSPQFRILGNLVAFGVLCAFVYATTFLPALLSLLPMRVHSGRRKHHAFFDRFGIFVVNYRRGLLCCSAIVSVAMVSGIPRIELTDNWTRYFSERYQFRQDTDFVIDNLTGMETLEFSLTSEREGGITEPAYLRKVADFADWFRAQPEVSHVHAFSDIMKHLNRSMHGDNSEFYRIPDNPELSAQYLILYELSLPFGSDLNNRLDVTKSATRMTVTMRNLTSEDQRELADRALAWIGEHAPGLTGGATGASIVFAHLSNRNIESMLRGTIIAVAIISLILVVAFRSMRLGIVSLLPNLLPVALALGLWGYLVGQVGLVGSVVAAIAFGIVVDDTVHFLSNYVRARREGLSAPEAVCATFSTTGQALWTTTAVLCLGFLVFAMSGFELSRSLGLLVTITLTFALLADFLLLPPLLMAIDSRKT